jgi:two-component system chemotaxis sensor kinase CheA
MSAYREVFLSESQEFLQLMNDALLVLEGNPGDLAPVDEIFRAAHSLKGMAAAMGYQGIADAAHELESLMDTVRRRERAITRELIDLLLASCDSLGEAVRAAAAGEADDDSLARLSSEIKAFMSAPSEAPAAAAAMDGQRYQVKVTLEENCVLRSVRAYMVLKRLSQIGEVIDTLPSMQDIEDEQFDRDFQVTLMTTASPETVESAVKDISEVEFAEVLTDSEPAVERRAQPRAPRLSDSQTVRVSVGHIDEMVDLVGELVITRSRLERLVAASADAELIRTVEELAQVSGSLQQVVLKTRMVPVAQIFNRFPRMMRDLANDLGRQVDFSMEGLDIELDRTVLDEIGDPLVHLLRNAVGHGVETPELRQAAGKDPTASIKLVAAREKTSVTIIVEDDGQGIDVEAVKAKAVERRVCTIETASGMTDQEVYTLICTPGFSTADAATELYGRGVGLDAVKEKIESLGGTMSIESMPGEGSRFVLALPLTLAIIQALLLEDADYVFAVPINNVVEVHSVEELKVKTVDGAPCAMLTERVIPLKPLQQALGWGAGNGKGGQAVVVAWRDAETGLIVDRLLGKQEVVIKPLPSWLRGAKGVAGATVLGDGRVALIVDVRSLITQEVRL